MAIEVKHSFVSAIADDPQAAAGGEVLPSHWNENHTITGTKADFDSACSDGSFVFSGDSAGGELGGAYPNPTVSNSAVIGKVLTGFAAAAGTVSATDNILEAFQKIVGNIAALVTGVSSVFGRTGAVTAQSGDYTTAQVTESGNLYHTDARAKAAAVADAINNGTTDVAPSQNAVFDALAGKSDTGHGHAISDVSGLQTALDGKASTSHAHTSGDVTDFAEAVDDRVAVLIQNGTGITWSYNDPSGTLTPTVTITQYTDELAQDAVGAMIAATDTINLTYTDGTPELKADARVQMSITSDASGLKLSGDSASPGNTMLYGTNGSGVKGWYAQPGGGGGSENIAQYTPDFHTDWKVNVEDFTASSTSTGVFTIAIVTGSGASGGASYTTADAATYNAAGVVRLETGTTSTGYGGRALISGAGSIGFESGNEYMYGSRIYVEDAPDATEDFYVFVGFILSSGNNPTTTNGSAGLYYDRNYTNWQTLECVGGSATYVDTGVAFAADTWFDLGVKVVGNDTFGDVSLTYYVNGTSVDTDTGVQNVSSLWNAVTRITKTAGTTERVMYLDHNFLATRRSS